MNEKIRDPQLIRAVGWTATLALLTGILGLSHATAIILGRFACGEGVAATTPLGGIVIALTGNPLFMTIPAGCQFPILAIRLVDAAIVIALVSIAIWGVIAWLRYLDSDAYFVREVRRRRGWATRSQLRHRVSSEAMLKNAKTLRPTLDSPSATDVGVRVGSSHGIGVYVSIEDSVLIEGAPRSGKGFRFIINTILDWSGPLITTSTRNDNLAATLNHRSSMGKVTVIDPQGLTGMTSTMKVSPIVGCDDPLEAVQRGQAIIAGTGLGASSSNQEWADAAAGILSKLLHACAVSGSGITELARWGSNPKLALQAVNILRTDGTKGWADDLDEIINGDEKLMSSNWFGVRQAVAPLLIPSIAESMDPGPGEHFDADEFLSGDNTAYLIGTGSGAGAVGGFLGATLDSIVETARRKALASPGSRLSRPLALVLDEIANMFSWPALPRIMSDGGGINISTFVVLQALSQAETSWSAAEASTIWSSATVKLLLGGASDVGHLRDVEALLGQRSARSGSRSTSQQGMSFTEQWEKLELMTLDEIRRMPQQMALMQYRNMRPIPLELRGWVERDDAAAIAAGKRETETAQQEVFAEQYARIRERSGGARGDNS